MTNSERGIGGDSGSGNKGVTEKGAQAKASGKNTLAKGNNSGVQLSRPVPVHLTYFTMAFDGVGKLQTFADVYGLDAKMAAVLFGKSDAIAADIGAERQKRSASNGGSFGSISGLFGN